MKTIYLIRHAKSDWNNTEIDFERTLSKKGKVDVKLISSQLGCNPDLIISSPAIRTKETSIVFAKALNYDEKLITYEMSIYEAPLENLIKKINTIGKTCNTALLVGHNPGITQLANYLTSDNLAHVKPCTVIKIELEVDNWNEIIEGVGSILSITQP